MTDSSDELKPLGRWALFGLALVRWLDKVGRILIPLAMLAVGTFATCRAERAKQKADAVKTDAQVAAKKAAVVEENSESGYQVFKHEINRLREEIAILKARDAARPPPPRRRRPPPLKASPPKPLPASLPQAKQVIERATAKAQQVEQVQAAPPPPQPTTTQEGPRDR